MASIINLDEYDDNFDIDGPGGSSVPDGYYTAKVSEASHETDGKEHVILTLRITDGEHNGTTLKSWMYLHTPDCKKITMETLERFGTPPRWSPTNAKQLIGKECRIKTENELDRQYSTVKGIYQRDVPGGKYDTVISKIEPDINTNGKKFLRVIFNIRSEGDFQRLNIIENWYLSEKAAKWTAGKLKRLGLTGDVKPSTLATLAGKKVRLDTVVTLGSGGRKNTNVQKMELLSVSTAKLEDDNTIVIDEDDVDGVILASSSGEFDEGFEDEIPF